MPALESQSTHEINRNESLQSFNQADLILFKDTPVLDIQTQPDFQAYRQTIKKMKPQIPGGYEEQLSRTSSHSHLYQPVLATKRGSAEKQKKAKKRVDSCIIRDDFNKSAIAMHQYSTSMKGLKKKTKSVTKLAKTGSCDRKKFKKTPIPDEHETIRVRSPAFGCQTFSATARR